MGGNLTQRKGFGAKRITKPFFLNLFAEMQRRITKHYPDVLIHLPKPIGDKPDFGDIDIVIGCDDESQFSTIAKSVSESMGIYVHYVHRNGTIYSYGLNDVNDISKPLNVTDEVPQLFQMDLIFCTKENFHFHKRYLDWNDVGNLIGMIASHHGMKLAQTGLYRVIYEDEGRTNFLGQRLITRDWNEMLRFFGLSVSDYENGFADLESVYRFIIISPLFQKRFFNPDTFNHEKRDRERSRPTFRAFMRFLENYSDQNQPTTQATIDDRILNQFDIDIVSIIADERKHFANVKRVKSLLVNHIRDWSEEKKRTTIPHFKKTYGYPHNFFENSDEQIARFLSQILS